jgi:hypothetical protein
MIVPLILLLIGCAGTLVALTQPGLSDLLMLGAPWVLASLFLLVQAYLRARTQVAQHWIVVDGSNVMHWKEGRADMATTRAVTDRLKSLGYTPLVVFDANAGYKIAGSYKHDFALGRMLGLPANQVMVVPKGRPADPTILAAARDLGASVVSNDRYRDWAETYAEVKDPGFLIQGGYRTGQLWLDLGDKAA